MYAILAILPILLAVFLMVAFNVKTGKAMAAAWFLCFIFGILFWRLNIAHAAAFTVLGFLSAFDIILIVFGAIFLLNTLIDLKFIESIGNGFTNITQDRRIQILIIGWFFTSFIEGAAGFGTPGALAAPLLVGLGVPPFFAGLATLIGSSVPTTFGAVGIPPITGFNTILPSIQAAFPGLDPELFRSQLFSRMALTNIFVGSLVPMLMLSSIVGRDGKKRGIKDALNILPLALFAGLLFTVSVYFVVTFIGPEVGSMLGALIALVIFVPLVRRGFLVPKEVYRFMDDPIIEITQETKSDISLGLAWSPYVVVALLLVVTRLPWLPIREWITAPERTIFWENMFGFDGITWAWRILNNPGIFPFLAVAICFMVGRKMKPDQTKEVLKRTGKQIKNAAIALMFGIALVQIMRNTSYSHPYGPLDAMTSEVAKSLVDIFGGMYPIISPIIGAFGALVSGSKTVANIMFMPLQFEAALLIGLPTVMIAMSQSIGAAIGNMVAINNIIAITATTNATGKEGKLLVSAAPPCLIYALLLSAMLFIYLALGVSWVA